MFIPWYSERTTTIYRIGSFAFKPWAILNFAALVIASYGVIHVLAQDIGIERKRTSLVLRELPMQALLFFCSAYMLTRDPFVSIFAVLLYYTLSHAMGETQEAGPPAPLPEEEQETVKSAGRGAV